VKRVNIQIKHKKNDMESIEILIDKFSECAIKQHLYTLDGDYKKKMPK
jgi:hypothetical protein